MKTFNLALLATLFLLTFLSIWYKINHVPMTHDEPATPLIYGHYSAWQIMMYPDEWPRNHILNTLATKASMTLFGKDQWVVRLPNLLSFLIFAAAIIAIIRLLFKPRSLLIIAAVFLFLGNPYLLDFFGLCRGYGMGVALVTASSAAMLYGFSRDRDRYIWLSVFLAILASYANFTMLVFLGASTLIAAGYLIFRFHNKLKRLLTSIAALVILSAGYFALIIVPIRKMTSTNQFEYWTSNGFYQDTLLSLADTWRYNPFLYPGITRDNIIFMLLLFTGIALVVVIVRGIFRREPEQNLKSPLTVALLLLITTVAVNFIQVLVLHTPNLSGRTALVLAPLFSLVLVALLSEFDHTTLLSLKRIFAIGIPLFLTLHMALSWNPKQVKEWFYDAYTFEVLEYLKERHDLTGEKIPLKTLWLFMPSFYFYQHTGVAPWLNLYPYDQEIDSLTDARFYYLQETDMALLPEKFRPVKYIGKTYVIVEQKNP